MRFLSLASAILCMASISLAQPIPHPIVVSVIETRPEDSQELPFDGAISFALDRSLNIAWKPPREFDSKSAQKALADFSSLAVCRTGGKQTVAEIVMKDFPVEETSRISEIVTKAYLESHRQEQFTVYLRDETKDGRFTQIGFSQFMGTWDKSRYPSGSRVLLFDGVAVISGVPADARQRREAAIEAISGRINGWLAMPGSDRALQAKPVASAVLRDFQKMDSAAVIDDKMTLYKVKWEHSLAASLMMAPESKVTAGSVISFVENLRAAGEGKKCTVTVGSSKGNGAEIWYAKAADAQFPARYLKLGDVLAIGDIEKGNYVFLAKREGKETGRETNVACTSATKPVNVRED